jgi:hypothetical protein
MELAPSDARIGTCSSCSLGRCLVIENPYVLPHQPRDRIFPQDALFAGDSKDTWSSLGTTRRSSWTEELGGSRHWA